MKYALKINFSKWLRNFQMLGATIVLRSQQYHLCVILPPIVLPDIMNNNTKMFIITLESIFSCELIVHNAKFYIDIPS